MESPSFAGLIAISVPMISGAAVRTASFEFVDDKQRNISALSCGMICRIGCGNGIFCRGSNVLYPKVSFFRMNVRNRIFAGNTAEETPSGCLGQRNLRSQTEKRRPESALGNGSRQVVRGSPYGVRIGATG